MSDRVLEEKQMEVERLTKRLDHMEQELFEKYCDVGRFVLETVERENREIDQLTDQVIEVKRELMRARGEIRCPHCFQYNDPESIYCNRCGRKLEEEKENKDD